MIEKLCSAWLSADYMSSWPMSPIIMLFVVIIYLFSFLNAVFNVMALKLKAIDNNNNKKESCTARYFCAEMKSHLELSRGAQSQERRKTHTHKRRSNIILVNQIRLVRTRTYSCCRDKLRFHFLSQDCRKQECHNMC